MTGVAVTVVYLALGFSPEPRSERWVQVAVSSGPQEGWTDATLPDISIPHELIIAVRQKNLDVLEQTLREVSEPRSSKYGLHLSFEAVGDLVRNDEGRAAVTAWLEAAGVLPGQCHATVHGEFLRCTAPIAVWEQALRAKFRAFSHRSEPAVIVARAPSLHVPQDMAPHIAAVLLGSELPSIGFSSTAVTRKLQAGAPPYCDAHPCCTPAVLNRAYNITDNSGGGLGSQAVFETGGQYMSPADLKAFQTKYGIPGMGRARVSNRQGGLPLCRRATSADADAPPSVGHRLMRLPLSATS